VQDEHVDLFEQAPCGYLVISTEGRIEKINATFARWIGRGAADLVGRRMTELMTIESSVMYETSVAPLLRLKGNFEEVALDLLMGDGQRLAVQVSGSERYDANGHPAAVRIVAVRATQRRGYERDLQSSEATAVRNLADEREIARLREQFIAVLGHDLRNPLASVSSGVRLLLRDPSREKAEKIAAIMHASVLRMATLIDNVLDFARGRLGGGITLQRAPVDLAGVIRQATAELGAANPGRVIIEAHDLPPLVDCDASRISQLISNLVGNAIAHGDPATFVAVESFVSHDELEIAVTNGGEPIPANKMKILFEPFSYEAGSTPRKGLGLGLFIASQIAKSHSGALTAISTPIETRFTFRMPLTKT
jgi:sigma-B regulation protein RsbU (phosphoserine phosphatase)